jgi:hypothetical protein
MSRRIRRSMLTAVVFVVAGIGGVIGNHVTKAIQPVAIAFVALLVVGGAAAFWVDRLTDSTDHQPGETSSYPPDTSDRRHISGNESTGFTVISPKAGRDINIARTINIDRRKASSFAVDSPTESNLYPPGQPDKVINGETVEP